MRQWLTNQMELPADVVADLPRITMIGHIHIYIENHRGLLLFTDRELRLLLKTGSCLSKGNRLPLKLFCQKKFCSRGKLVKFYIWKNRGAGVKTNGCIS